MKKFRAKKTNISNKPVIIADLNDDRIIEYRCEKCRLTIGVRPSNNPQQQEITCSRCGEVIAILKARKVSKLETPHRNTETLVSTTPMPNYGDVAIKKPANYRGAFKLLLEKGIKITSYDVRDGGGKPIYEEDE